MERKNRIIKKELSIEEQDHEGSKTQNKFKINKQARNYFKNKINSSGIDKLKVKFLKEGLEKEWQPGKKQKYLEIRTTKQTTSLFKARNRMLDVKNNFRGKHKDMKCRLCEKENETQEHILEECQIIQEKIEKKITKTDLFQEDETKIKETATKIIEIETIVENVHHFMLACPSSEDIRVKHLNRLELLSKGSLSNRLYDAKVLLNLGPSRAVCCLSSQHHKPNCICCKMSDIVSELCLTLHNRHTQLLSNKGAERSKKRK